MTRVLIALLDISLLTCSGLRADPPSLSAHDLAARLAAAQQGDSYIRLVLQTKAGPSTARGSLQVQIKERRADGRTDVMYQVLWPKERKGEGVLLHQEGSGRPSGTLFKPSEGLRSLGPSEISESLLGSSLSYEDAGENIYSWDNQSLAGTDVIDRVTCQILESRSSNGASVYGRVRSWIDTRRMVPLRIEKYLPSGALARRIDITRVANDGKGRPIPADLTVTNSRDGSETSFNGSRIRYDVTFTEKNFSPDALKILAIPHTGPR